MMNSRRLIASSRGSGQGIVAAQTSTVKGPAQCPLWVISGHSGNVSAMSALPPKADRIGFNGCVFYETGFRCLLPCRFA